MFTMTLPRYMLHRKGNLEPGQVPEWDRSLTATLIDPKDRSKNDPSEREGFPVAVMFSSETTAQKFIDFHPDENWQLLCLDDDALLKLLDRTEHFGRFKFIAVDRFDDPKDQGKSQLCLTFEPKTAIAALKEPLRSNGQVVIEEQRGYVV